MNLLMKDCAASDNIQSKHVLIGCHMHTSHDLPTSSRNLLHQPTACLNPYLHKPGDAIHGAYEHACQQAMLGSFRWSAITDGYQPNLRVIPAPHRVTHLLSWISQQLTMVLFQSHSTHTDCQVYETLHTKFGLLAPWPTCRPCPVRNIWNTKLNCILKPQKIK